MQETPSTDPDRWLRRFAPSPEASARVVFLPHAGGAASYYFPLCKELSGVADTVAVQYPGRQERRAEPFVDDLHHMADLLADVLEGQTERPTVLFGHSMGALVAFELGLRLEARGRGPAAVLVSARRAPSEQRVEELHLRDDNQILEELRRLNGTQAAFLEDEELVGLVLPTLRADYRAISTYRYRPGLRLTAPVSVLVGDEDQRMSINEASLWERHTAGGVDVQAFQGGHFYLAQHVRQVAELVERRLRETVPADR